jgi:hypothetical protein
MGSMASTAKGFKTVRGLTDDVEKGVEVAIILISEEDLLDLCLIHVGSLILIIIIICMKRQTRSSTKVSAVHSQEHSQDSKSPVKKRQKTHSSQMTMSAPNVVKSLTFSNRLTTALQDVVSGNNQKAPLKKITVKTEGPLAPSLRPAE